MRKLQAAMKDASFNRSRQYRGYYRAGSYFKGCLHCGEVEWVSFGNTEVKRYLSGYDVFRAYCPAQMGWTYWCYTCGAKDQACWENAEDIGRDAIRGTRGAIAAHKLRLRKEKLAWWTRVKVVVPTPEEVARLAKVAALEDEIRKLQELIRKGGE
jgi:hypothetical protein